MHVLTIAFLASCSASTVLLGQQAGAQVEQQIVTAVDQRAEQAVALLEQIVNINSGTMNFPGVREVGRVLSAEFDALGLETEWIDGSGFERAGHLIARLRGAGPHILLIGHLDTVFEPDSPFQRFERGENNSARGPGVVDMKGGDVVIIEALRAIKAAGALAAMNLTVVMTGDEERSGRPLQLARKHLIDAAKDAVIALAFENGDSDTKTAVVARRGSTAWRLEVSGTPAHSSQIFQPEVGAGAIYEMARILTGFYQRLAGEPLLTFNPGVLLAGTAVDHDPFLGSGSASGKSNIVAKQAVATGDLRTISLEQLASTRAQMSFIASQNLPGTTARIHFDDGYPPMSPSEGNLRLLAHYDQVSQDLGFGPVTAVDPRKAGAADVSFVAGHVEMAIDGLGTGGGNDHTVAEWIDLPTLALQTKRAAVLIYRLSETK